MFHAAVFTDKLGKSQSVDKTLKSMAVTLLSMVDVQPAGAWDQDAMLEIKIGLLWLIRDKVWTLCGNDLLLSIIKMTVTVKVESHLDDNGSDISCPSINCASWKVTAGAFARLWCKYLIK